MHETDGGEGEQNWGSPRRRDALSAEDRIVGLASGEGVRFMSPASRFCRGETPVNGRSKTAREIDTMERLERGKGAWAHR
jgi:hypothetical protein